MDRSLQFYIDGEWVEPLAPRALDVINPATEQVIAQVSLGGAVDVDRAVEAARGAFESYSRTTRAERVALLERVALAYEARIEDLASAITSEMGAPRWLARKAQAPSGLGHLKTTLSLLRDFAFEESRGKSRIVREAVGVCGLITPWNWPANQIMCKVAPALAAGCTMVLKPSEMTPLSALIIAEILDDAGLPRGVFNLVNGDGPGVGAAVAAHPDIDMVSFTGSTRAGVLVAKVAAETVKRVTQELGGKSPNLILPDADLAKAVARGVELCLRNSGQSCNAPTRMLIHRSQYADAIEVAKETAAGVKTGDPNEPGTVLGPVASRAQFEKIQALIQDAIDEGAELVAGGVGKPDGLETGFYVKPTVFSHVENQMRVAREEIFGPVLVMIAYDDEEQAIRLANDTEYGLSAYVQSAEVEHALAVASRLRAGQVHLNGAGADFNAPFGGYKRSGNGREWGEEGLSEFLEVKALMGL